MSWRRRGGFAGPRLALIIVAAPLACSAPDNAGARGDAERPSIRIAQDDAGANLIPALRDALARAMPDLRVEVLDSSAGVTNLVLLQRGEVDTASTFADIAYMASVGQLPDMTAPFEQLRAIAALPARELQMVVAPGSSIGSIHGLRGRRVSLGPPGTGVALTAQLLLSAFAIDVRDIEAEHLAFSEAADALMDREIDAAFWGGRFPNANIGNALSHGARLLQIVGPEIERFRAEYPFLRPMVIRAGAHPGLDYAVHTVGVDRILVCRADLDERLVYTLTKAFFQAVAFAGRDVRMFHGFNMSRAGATPLPLHPGAARYYREVEIRR